MAAYDFPDTAGKPTDGSFNYTAPDGTLYEWNGYAWEVPGGSGGSGGGGGDFDIPTQALPPQVAEDGDLWWCTDDGRLYIYYEDVDTTQWVDASPDNGGAGSGDGSDSIWERTGSTISPVNAGDGIEALSAKFAGGKDIDNGLSILGGGIYYRNNAGIEGIRLFNDGSGAPKASIFTSGSATFAGNIQCGGQPSDGTDVGSRVNSYGTVMACRDSASSSLYLGYLQGNATETFRVNADGSASFAGALNIASSLTAFTTAIDIGTDCHIRTDGTIYTDPTANGYNIGATDGSYQFRSRNSDGSSIAQLNYTNLDGLYRITNGTTTWNLAADGSATFAGALTLSGTYNSTSGPSPRALQIGNDGRVAGLASTRAAKKNIEYDYDTSWVRDLKPVSYNYRVKDEVGAYTSVAYESKEYGLIAEDVELVNPAICNYGADDELVGVEYARLISPILSQLQTALTRIEALEAEVQSLKGGNS